MWRGGAGGVGGTTHGAAEGRSGEGVGGCTGEGVDGSVDDSTELARARMLRWEIMSKRRYVASEASLEQRVGRRAGRRDLGEGARAVERADRAG